MYLFKKKCVAEREGKKLSRKSICNIRGVCNRYVSNDCTISNVASDVSVVSNIKNKKSSRKR